MAIAPRDPVSLPVVESSQAGEVRRTVAVFAAALGFDETRAAAAAIVATELSSNLARHAKGGEVVLRSLQSGKRIGVELLSVDRGPSIANLRDALRDGFSTGGTPGTGMGAAARMADVFDVSTSPGKGTVIVARLWASPTVGGGGSGVDGGAGGSAGDGDGERDDDDVGVVCLPLRGEVACGDAWAVADGGGGRCLAIVADGLGHGLQAADASRVAIRLFREHLRLSPAHILERLHAGLRSTRGAAVSIAEIWRGRRTVRFAGVGNVAAMVIGTDGKTQSMVSHNGTIGAEARRIQEFEYPFPSDAVLLLHSDGLASQWQLGHYPGLRSRHPSVISGVLYRDYRRERDDVTVLTIGSGGGMGQA